MVTFIIVANQGEVLDSSLMSLTCLLRSPIRMYLLVHLLLKLSRVLYSLKRALVSFLLERFNPEPRHHEVG